MTARLVVSSDWHHDWATLGVSRGKEVEAAVEQVVRHAVDVNADAFLFLGDLCDPDSGGETFNAIAFAIRIALRLDKEGIRSIWIQEAL